MPAYQSNRELWASFVAILVVSIAYGIVTIWLNGFPGASSLFGHGIGIVGFLMMLMTETLYTIRKRQTGAGWGRMSDWLNFHIFTGLVGPYMVFLHTSWKFNGIAGIVMLMTVFVVASGIIGRYIYTALPRTADGVVIEVDILESEIAKTNQNIQNWMESPAYLPIQRLVKDLIKPNNIRNPLFTLLGQTYYDWYFQIRWWSKVKGLNPDIRQKLKTIGQLGRRRQTIQFQVDSMVLARRLFAVWHTIHIPMGMVLFAAALIHIVAAVYYATLLY